MENIAVHCSWADAHLAQDSVLALRLPHELRIQILQTSGVNYLNALSIAARQPDCTDRLFAFYRPIFIELVARWVSATSPRLDDDIITLSCLARISPFSLQLKPLVQQLLHRENFSFLHPTGNATVHDLPETQLTTLLLTLFRLLSLDRDYFGDLIRSDFLTTLLDHESLQVRYLAITTLCQVMHFADAYESKLVEKHIGRSLVLGSWEDKDIDFRLFKLWEERRWKEFEAELERFDTAAHQSESLQPKQLCASDLSPQTAIVGGVLLPRAKAVDREESLFVLTPTAHVNLHGLGQALVDEKAVLLAGPEGSGKSSLIFEAARLLNKLASMITLILNEQTDAKSLIGLYTSSATDSSFTWRPGVLTKAMEEGRWVLIEDIDRAPPEVLSVLRPIIENGNLVIPSRKQTVHAKDGFRVIATIQSRPSSSTASMAHTRQSWLANQRLWSVVHVLPYGLQEVAFLLSKRFANTASLMETILAVHRSVCDRFASDPSFRAAQGRSPSLRDLLKWCRRINGRINGHDLSLAAHTFPESFYIEVFKDSLDCYASYLADETLYGKLAASVAQEMSIAPQQMEYFLKTPLDSIVESRHEVKIARSTLPRLANRSRVAGKLPFASTSRAKRSLETIAASISFSEPCLIVGETGVGKTSTVQYIAEMIGQKLTVVNLSQQSEATDLLGGLKPVTTRSLVLPLAETFNALFDDTFSAGNEKFKGAVSRALAKQSWSRLLKLWQEALQLANQSLDKAIGTTEVNGTSPATKKRKLDTSRNASLRQRWSTFSSSINSLQAQIRDRDKSHTFAFVEGRLVQAVRNGEWLLLDEINLATSDTLDHVGSLLNDGGAQKPFVMLTEAGEVEKIEAHPNFRIFAAMNPATDAGKKDLAAAVRSRFTEHYVHPGDRHVEDLVKIIHAYLGNGLNGDKRAAFDLANAYLGVQKLNEDHKLIDGAGEAPHFSIRSLVRCLLYVVQHHISYGLRRSMFEGFAMSFFTTLSKGSEHLSLSVITPHLLSNVKNIKSFLGQQPRISEEGVEYIAFRHHLIPRGPLTPDFQPHYIRTPSVERNLLNLARAASMNRFPILLQGPTSSGKTSMVEYLAKLSGNRFVRINNHEHTDLQEYLGSYASGPDGKLLFRDGVLVEALRHGHWLVLDELNLAPSDVLEALNRLLDDNRELLIPETQEIVRPHPSFMLFATQNPAGLYGGRKRLSRAFRNRFLEIHFDDIPEEELEIILRERAQIAPSFCAQIVVVYKKLALQRQSSQLFEQRNSFATLRDLFRWASRQMDDRQQLAHHGFMLLAERVRDITERQIVKTAIEETMKVKIDEIALYNFSHIRDEVKTTEGIVWTTAMRRLYVLVSEALKNKEPVLLVGETGCGKTQICQAVAQAFGRTLNIYNAHTNTETGDLIGSQRPVRSRSQLARDVLDSLQAAGGLVTNGSWPQGEKSIDQLIAQFNDFDTSSWDVETLARVKTSIGAYRSLFLWSDGSLVRSMKAGEHFLLDEISLADDSVLERLNSVLEPSRTILLAEKGSHDSVVTAQPEFQFLATMNPGGDYGKRELSAALRNRLTEIWVPSLSQEDDLMPILKARLITENVRLAPLMFNFAVWFKNTFCSASAQIALRDLLAWAAFVNHVRQLPSDVAFVHGAGLVYIDALGANPAGATAYLTADINQSRRKCIEYLQTLVSVDVEAVYSRKPDLKVGHEAVAIGPFSLRKGARMSQRMTDLVFDAPTTLKNALRIMRGLQMSRPILLEGNPGVGKTAVITALASLLGKPFTRINLSDQTDLMDLFGADAPVENESLGSFAWKDGPLLTAMQEGGWILLDEMNLASQSILEGLNSCLDHRKEVYVAELDKTFSCHPDFTLFAAQNPHQQGGGRKGLPASFVNRFTVVYADPFQEEDFLTICKVQNPAMATDQLNAIIRIVSAADGLVAHSSAFGNGGPWELNLRDVSRWFQLSRSYPAIDPMYHFDTIVAHRFRGSKQRSQLRSVMDQCMPEHMTESFYPRLSPDALQVGLADLRRDSHVQPVETKASIPVHLLPQAKSIITAISHKWPVVLAGSSGVGKTQLIRSLAAASGARLVEISMNADTDTVDLLGGFEQYDDGREFERIKNQVLHVTAGHIQQQLTQAVNHDLSGFLYLLERCRQSSATAGKLQQVLLPVSRQLSELQPLYKQLASIVQKGQATVSRFVWNDGVLVDAVQQGAWVVLDNANLCNASVLDRLNSLLEPDGHLIISERHNADDGIGSIEPHPDFRVFLTMDPRYGELSRAMRNRSLEIYLEMPEPDLKASRAIHYPFVSSIGRLRDALQGDREPAGNQPYIDNLSLQDYAIVNDNLRFQQWPQPGFAAEFFQRATIEPLIWHNLTILASLRPNTNPQMDIELFGTPQLPLLNEPMMLRAHAHKSSEVFAGIASAWNLALQLAHLQTCLLKAAERVKSISVSDMTALERSLAIYQRSASRNKPAPKISEIMTVMLDALLAFLKHCSTSPNGIVQIQNAFPLGQFMRDIMRLFEAKDVDMANFQALLMVGADLCNAISSRNEVLSEAFQASLAQFQVMRLQRGQGLQRMWQTWKSKTPLNMSQLANKLALEQMVEKFDSICDKLPQSRKELLGIKKSLLHAAASVWEQAGSAEVMSDLGRALDVLESQAIRRTPVASCFRNAFEAIARRIFAAQEGKDVFSIQALATFSSSHLLRPAVLRESPTPDALRKLAGLYGHLDRQASSLASTLVHKAAHLQGQPLRSLDRLTEECDGILSLISTNAAKLMSDLLVDVQAHTTTLLSAIIEPHNEVFGAPTGLDGFEPADVLKLPSQVDSEDFAHLQEILQSHLKPAAAWLSQTKDSLGGSHTHTTTASATGGALMHVALAALKLMVPDRLFDPAIYPQVVRERYIQARSEICIKIEGLRRFNLQLTGQESSLLLRIYEHQLDQLGNEPVAAAVARPEVSELSKVQEEFTNVIRTVVDAEHATFLHWNGADVGRIAHESRGLSATIDRLLARLGTLHRAYDDIVVPIKHLLQCLGLGAELVATDAQWNGTNSTVQGISRRVPLVGGTLENRLSCAFDTTASEIEKIKWLKLRCLQRRLLRHEDVAQSMQTTSYVQVLDAFYRSWKTQLTEDQSKAEANSRYYAYRDDEQEEDTHDREVAELFPIYEAQNDGVETALERTQGQNIAVQLAALHEQFFVDGVSTAEVKEWATDALTSTFLAEKSATTLEQSLAGILLQLRSQMRKLKGSTHPKAMNIYTDPSIEEARKLFALAQKIQSRFFEISDQWPEHSVPLEVISFADAVLDFKLDSPLAKFLTKVEKLLEIIAQWQSVASREWSVVTLMDDLTMLIVRWRQMELTSWSRLLDLEKQKSDDFARSWYFIAYEAVIYNSRRVVEDSEDVSLYCQGLVRTLEEFLRSVAIGQFIPRLRLLEMMSKTLAELTEEDTRLKPVLCSVQNVIFHFSRYETGIEETLRGGRDNLEKAVTEQIKLASWKDTNITTLRDSARRSHHKLFKIVRKYRALLGKPVTVLKANEIDYSTPTSSAVVALHVVQTPHSEIGPVVDDCAQNLTDWRSRPERLQNPIVASSTMRQVYGSHEQDLNVGAELESVRLDLILSIKSLRSETPSNMTEDNAGLIKHLGERKRKLLADTVKSLAHMGVRRNLATAELEMQVSTAVLLASSPDVLTSSSTSASSGCTEAVNETFHELLDSMPQVRAAYTEHSPDLTDGDVRRGVGLLEGLLSLSVKQRRLLNMQSLQLRHLEKQLGTLRSICNTKVNVSIGTPDKANNATLLERISWLPLILDMACGVLEIQAEHSEMQLDEPMTKLRNCTAFARDSQAELAELRQCILPGGLSSRSVANMEAHIWQELQRFGQALNEWSVLEPNVAYLLKQLVPWTEKPSALDAEGPNESTLVARHIDAMVRTTADSIFVALQGFSKVKGKNRASFEDAGWLVQSDKFTMEAFEALHLTTIANGLLETLEKLHKLKVEELPLTISLLRVMMPILQQYYMICEHVHKKQAAVHLETCRLACCLAKSFAIIAKEGFCQPAGPSDGQEQTGKLESGTGLGEGEGAEDISKDVGADEDMSEFAQSGEKQEEEGEMSDVEDAVDMGVDELEGETGDQGESKERDSGSDGEEGESSDEMDEESGSVDGLDPTAVDEKMWDEAKKEVEGREKELKTEKQNGEKSQDQTERQDGQAEGENEGEVEDGEANDEEIDDEDVGDGKAEAENADPHLQDEKALELPEEMQLNGEEEGKEDDTSDDGIGELSDVDQPDGKLDEFDDTGEPDREEDGSVSGDDQQDQAENEDEAAEGPAYGDEIQEDQPAENEEEVQKDHDERDGDMAYDEDQNDGGETGKANHLQEGANQDQTAEGQNELDQAEDDEKPEGGKAANERDPGASTRSALGRGTRRDHNAQRPQDEALRRLADMLDQWHQRREIFNPTEDKVEGKVDEDVDMVEADFEHVDGEDRGDTQALGAASTDQAQNLDPSKAIRGEDRPIEDDIDMPDVQEQEQEDQAADRLNRLQASSAAEPREEGAYVPNQDGKRPQTHHSKFQDAETGIDDTSESMNDLSLAIDQTPPSPPTTSADATELWSYCSAQVHQFSLILTEQLRLILSPTTATKLRGDFRTGKRLNIKRIIPYIASGYKRDKIWMRRSIPSKRNYQILLAVDDSKSMSESGADLLALQTVALLCKSLSMLEVGEIAVIGFGENEKVTLAHEFGKPWTNESGVEVFTRFGFTQQGTNVKSMVSQSLNLLKEARLKSHASNTDELWQLQLIISDGHCSDHDAVRRLVRQAKDERVVMVFVIVDNPPLSSEQEGGRQGESILDLKEAVFEPDTREGREGEMRVVTRRYLEGFPFEYYLVVRDVRDLPGVLSRCLRGWFGSVVDK